MNNLVILNDADVPVTTSLLVAKNFGKEHFHVMDTIRSIISTLESNKIGASNFRLSSYRSSQNKAVPMYEMDRNAYAQLVNGFTGEQATLFRKKYADAFDAMEEELMKPKAPKELSRMEILQMAIDSEMRAVALEDKITVDAPKVQAFETYLTTDNSLTFTEVAKSIGFRSANALCKVLREDGILFKEVKTGTKAMPMAPYAKYFDMTRIVPEGQTKSYPQTRVTPEGHEWIRNKFGWMGVA